MIRRFFWLLTSLFLFQGLNAQQFINDKVDIIEGSGQYLLNEVVYKPANFSTSKSYPLVLFFHGMGEAGTDVNRVYNTGLPRVLKDGYKPSFDFIMVAPQHTSYSLDPKHINSILIETLAKFPNIDQSRIYITGLSAGGWSGYGSSLNINSELGKKFAAIVLMSAATQDVNKNNYSWWTNLKTPLWAVVGNNDVSYRDQNKDLVNNVNAKAPGVASITIRSGVGHGGWNDVYNGSVKTADGKNMYEWMYQFSRNSSGAIVTNGSTPPPPAPTNQAPSVNAGTDKSTILPLNSVQLNGSASDADGSIASYNWTKISGPSQFYFNSTTTAAPTVSNLEQGTYTFRLTATDNNGASSSDDVNVVVNDAVISVPPPSSSSRFIKVNLFGGSNGYSSSEWNNWNTYNNSGNFKYSDGSASSVSADLSTQSSVSDNGSTYSGTMAPGNVLRYASYSGSNRTLTISGLDNSKTYNLELYASRKGTSNNTTRFTTSGLSVDVKTDDNTNDKAIFSSLVPSSGKIVVNISKLNSYNYLNGFSLTENSNSIVVVNSQPTANAGSNKTITLPLNSVQLSGSASDIDGNIASYNWTKISGPSSYSFNSSSVATPTVSNLTEGTYIFRLTAVDNVGANASDEVTVTVNAAQVSTPAPTVLKYIKVNLFGGSGAYTSGEWNNWNSYNNAGNFKYSDGSSSSISADLSQQSGVSDNGSSYTASMAPGGVVRFASYSTSNRTLTITGLDNNKIYDLEIYGSRSGTSNNTTRYTVSGSSVDIKTDNNASDKAVFQSLSPVSGKITISISKLNSYNYINGFTLVEKN